METDEKGNPLTYWGGLEKAIKITLEEAIENKIKGEIVEKGYSEEEVRKSLLDIVLVNPAHISLLRSGYGQFPDTFELTEKGVDYIVEQFKKK
jgi:hypothetical protein